MVTSRKPKKKVGQPPLRETLGEKFERLLSLPEDAPLPKLTKREARYFLRQLAGSNPAAPSGIAVLREFYGDWSEDDRSA